MHDTVSPAVQTFSIDYFHKYWTWVHTFILVQFTLQILLLFPFFGMLRVPMRVATFALSLFLITKLRGQGIKHPATLPALGVIGIMVLSLLHPTTNTLLAGLAQCAIYLAILGPLFWVKNVPVTVEGFQGLILIMWGFHTLSSIFGVLQVYFPGRFQPFISIAAQQNPFLDGLLITLANGEQVYRPMGLTDQPGGAAVAGFYALLLGLGIALNIRNRLLQVACIGSAAMGLFCIYLCQVRSILIFALVCVVCLAIVLLRQAEFGRLATLGTWLTGIVLGTFSWAVAVGGKSTFERLSSLISDRADLVYQQNRGHFLEDTINVLLPQYPLGAGLGRWGMMYNYFGDKNSSLSPSIWVEIQWTGWLLDGGIPLIMVYVLAIALACYVAWNIATSSQLGEFRLWGGLIFAYNIGALAITFNYPLFISQGGMEFWLLNAALFAAAHNYWYRKNTNVFLS